MWAGRGVKCGQGRGKMWVGRGVKCGQGGG